MYKYFISYMFSDKENHSGFGNTVCSSEKKITDLDAIIEIENNIKEVSIQQEDDEYTRYLYKNSKVIILNFTLLEDK